MVDEIVKGIEEKKGKKIVIVDMQGIEDTPCSYFVIAEGTSEKHVNALGHSVKDYVYEKIKEKPFGIDGFKNSQWILLDYGSVMVHLFQREYRDFYDLEHLWGDADLTYVEDLD